MKSIRSKLWLGITSLVLLIIILLWTFQVVFLNKFYITERKNALIDEGKKLVGMFKEDGNLSDRLYEEIKDLSDSYNTRVLIYDYKNQILYENFIPFEKKKNIRLPEIDILEQLHPYKIQTIVSDSRHKPNAPFILVKIPIIIEDSLMGNILLTTPLAPINETTSILKKQLSIISLISLAIATALALAFSRYFTKPILRIIEASKKITRGDYSVEVKLDSRNDELGILGATINNMAKELTQTEKLRRDFIANTSHELKTPISLIKAYSETIKDIELDDESKKEYLQIIIDESNRLNEMVEDILYLSKMESGNEKIVREEFELVGLLQNVIEKLEFLSNKKNIKIEIISESKDVKIYADKNKMYQVFYNLINNAINHSYNNSKIVVKIQDINNKVRVEIIDYGKGIPKEDLPYIWDRFYKVDKSRKRDISGTGLGMAIVKNILEAHGYKYGIESEVNKGTKVWIEMI